MLPLNQAKDVFCLKLTIIHHLRLWPHPLNCVRTCMWLQFLLQSSRYGYYSRAATIQGAASVRINTVLMV